MKFIQIIAAIAVISTPLPSMACTPIDPSVAYAKGATFAATGYEAGDRWVSSASQLIVRVTIKEILFGESARQMEAESPCAFPFKPHEKVVVARIDGNLLVYPADIYEQSFRQAFGKGG